jgi:hypothetical protein
MIVSVVTVFQEICSGQASAPAKSSNGYGASGAQSGPEMFTVKVSPTSPVTVTVRGDPTSDVH